MTVTEEVIPEEKIKTSVPAKYDKIYEALIDLVGHEHWVAIYEDGRGRKNIRIINGADAWKFDIQVGMVVQVQARPYNKCKLVKSVSRPV